MINKIIIAIDGHSSTGKSTLAKMVAKELKYKHINTGAMYRALTLHALRHNWITDASEDIEAINVKKMIKSIDELELDFRLDQDTHYVMYMNNENVDFEIKKGLYTFSAMFTAKDGTDTSSFNYTGVNRLKLNKDFKDQGYISNLLNQSEEQVKAFPVKEKFVGQVVVTPHCLSDFISFIDGSISDGAIISGTSIYKNKINDKIASDIFSLSSNPVDDRIDAGYFITSDTYKAKNMDIIQ